MKATFRETFINCLDKHLKEASRIVSLPHANAVGYVETVENATNKRISKGTPDWVFNKIITEISRGITSDSKRDILKSTVERACAEAAGRDYLEPSKALMAGGEFLRLVSSLRSCLSKETYTKDSHKAMQLVFTKDSDGNGTVTGYSCDGYRIMKHTEKCFLRGEPFTVYVRMPKVKPTKYDLVTVQPDGDAAIISFDDVRFTTKISEKTDLAHLFEDLAEKTQEQTRIGVNPEFLRDMVSGVVAGKTYLNKKIPLVMEMGSETSALHLQCGDTEAYLLPVRLKG